MAVCLRPQQASYRQLIRRKTYYDQDEVLDKVSERRDENTTGEVERKMSNDHEVQHLHIFVLPCEASCCHRAWFVPAAIAVRAAIIVARIQ